MANRFPLVLDTDAGNKLKELPSGDNLNLRECSIVNVQDITALGTINAADIRVNGNRLVAQSFADLTDTPNTFAGAANYFVKVKEDGTGLEFRPFSDIGNIEVEQIEVSDVVLPTVDNTVDIGSDLLRFRTITAVEFKGDLLANDDSKVFDADTGFISYAALQGAPQFLSEFTDDIGFLRISDLDTTLSGLFDEGVPFATDIIGSVFADDSTLLVDAVNGVIPYSVLDGVPVNLSDFNNDLDYAGIVGITIQTNGLPVNTYMTGDLDAQGNSIENANLVNATGDLNGSIFADDSSVMVDAANFTMFTDAMTLTPLNAEPAEPIIGMLVAADGISWDPASKAGAVPYPVFYDGVTWNALY